MILGIDVGGTTVKFGVVTLEGGIVEKKAYNTHAWDSSVEAFIENLTAIILDYQERFEITGVGIGFPGLLTTDRISTYMLANIPCLNDQPVVSMIREKIKNIPIKIENDAKCAALGEIYFGQHHDLNSYLMISLGTGVGGGLVMDRSLFIGINGNATEIGHIPLSDGLVLEDHVGQEKITAFTTLWLQKEQYKNSLLQHEELSPKTIFDAAENGDQCAKDVFFYVGECVGEMLIGVMRLLDLSTFLLAGGVSGATDYIRPGIISKIKEHLPPYYTDKLDIRKASLNNEAGILGAASLIMHEHETISA